MKSKFLGSLIFNVTETLFVIIIGRLFSLPIIHILLLMLIFLVVRNICGMTIHFKTWYRCFLWSSLVFTTIFLVAKIGFIEGLLFTILSAYLMTGKSNINELFLWKPTGQSKYSDIDAYIKYNEVNPRLMDFEDNLRRRDRILFLIYKYRFREKLSFSEISDRLEIDNARIVEKLDQIALAIRISCEI